MTTQNGTLPAPVLPAPLTREELEQALAAAIAEKNALLAARTARAPRITMKVSPKGCVSIYGLKRFPISEYPETWLKILEMGDEIRAFVEANRSKGLKFKG